LYETKFCNAIVPRGYSAICKEIIKRKLNLKWRRQVFPPNVTEEIISLMKEAGNIQIGLGIETDNTESLGKMKKNINSEGILKAIKIIKKYKRKTNETFNI